MTVPGAARMRRRLLAATAAAVLAVLLLLPSSAGAGDPPRCHSALGTRTACDAAGQNLALVGAFAGGGLVWWLSGSRALPPLRRR